MNKRNYNNDRDYIMMPAEKNMLHIRKWPVGPLVFFVCYFLYAWKYIDTSLIYHGFGMQIKYPHFSTGWSFFVEFAAFPGGLITYAGRFLSQLYYFPWLGALIITLVAVLICCFTWQLIRMAGARHTRLLHYLPAVPVLMIYNRYDNPIIECLALLTALLFSVVYEVLAGKKSRSTFMRASIFLGQFIVLYYLAAGACLLFAALVVTYESFIRKKPLASLLTLLCGLGVVILLTNFFLNMANLPYTLGVIWGSDLIGTYLYPFWFYFTTTSFSIITFQVLLGLIFLMVFLTALGQTSALQKVFARRGRKKTQESTNNKSKVLLVLIQTIIAAAIGVSCVWFSIDSTNKNLLKVNSCFMQEKWPQLLAAAGQLTPQEQTFCTRHDVIRALYYTGQLPDKLFQYPQDARSIESLLLSMQSEKFPFDITIRKASCLLEFGSVNRAEKILYEILEYYGNHPAILEQLAKINMVKGKMEAAKVFLKALSKNVIQGDYAREILAQLDEDPQLAGDERIGRIRRMAVDKDEFERKGDFDSFFKDILAKARKDKMTFEYMMSFYLLTRQLDKFIENIPRLDDFGYSQIPGYYQEAILIYQGTKGKKVDLHGRKISKEVVTKHNQYFKLAQQYGTNHQAAFKALAPDFGNTYIFYYRFERSGLAK